MRGFSSFLSIHDEGVANMEFVLYQREMMIARFMNSLSHIWTNRTPLINTDTALDQKTSTYRCFDHHGVVQKQVDRK